MEAKTLPPIDPQFIIERQGKKMVLYAGLLHQAHLEGLSMIQTRLIQVPSDENALTAICSATVRTNRGEFSGIGDAGPSNVSRMILSATIRMAETRAKARALRDACDIGMVALEELADEPEPQHAAAPVRDQRPSDPPTQARPPASSVQPPVHSTVRPASAPGPGEAVTPAQLRAIFAIGKDRKLSEGEVNAVADALFGSNVEGLTRKEASTIIDRLKSNAPLPAPESDDSPPF